MATMSPSVSDGPKSNEMPKRGRLTCHMGEVLAEATMRQRHAAGSKQQAAGSEQRAAASSSASSSQVAYRVEKRVRVRRNLEEEGALEHLQLHRDGDEERVRVRVVALEEWS